MTLQEVPPEAARRRWSRWHPVAVRERIIAVLPDDARPRPRHADAVGVPLPVNQAAS